MKIIKYGSRCKIDTEDYDHSKLKVGDKVVCIDDSIIALASMSKYGETYEIKEINPDGLWMNSWLEDKYKNGYEYNGKNYLGTIVFDRTYNYYEPLTQSHTEWIQRFVLESDYKNFMREQKLGRILDGNNNRTI